MPARTTRLLHHVLLAVTALALAGALTLVAAIGFGGGSKDPGAGSSGTAARANPGIDPAAIADAPALVATLQARVKVTPQDQRAWSNLALAYVEQARITADPTYYPKAQRALDKAARLAPRDSVTLTARATLQAARHDFTGSLAATDQALAVNPYNAQAAAIRSDALTELGRYREALAAASRADGLDPGPSTFARLSYQSELRGDLRDATRLMHRALEAAGTSAPSYAFAAFHLGELARAQGKPAEAMRRYRAALDADPTYMPALAGVARLEVARGNVAAAVRDYTRVVQRLPLTEFVVELGELYESTGSQQLADEQYAVATASAKLLAANGVATDLETAVFQADHGSPAEALTAARAEWSRRHSIHTADALAWALHANGDDKAALGYARQANRLGARDARLVFHLGAIEAANGLPSAAATLRDARKLDAGVSPSREAAIVVALKEIR